jgi:hypothetical protein
VACRRLGVGWMAYVASFIASMACGTSPDSPLGGPYGGGAYRLGPTDGGFSKVDATFTVPKTTNPAAPAGEPGTWTHIFTLYMAEGTFGNCTDCHPEMSDAPKSYQWLADQDYMGGSTPPLTDRGSSCLSWYGGDMPPGAIPPDQKAVAEMAAMEMNAWAAAGGKNN